MKRQDCGGSSGGCCKLCLKFPEDSGRFSLGSSAEDIDDSFPERLALRGNLPDLIVPKEDKVAMKRSFCLFVRLKRVKITILCAFPPKFWTK